MNHLTDKQVVVVGAGAIGLSCALRFAQQGAQVTLIDRQDHVAKETSFANGAQISACNTVPWSSPGAIGKALRWMFNPKAPLLFVPTLDPFQYQWLLHFALNTFERTSMSNTQKLLHLSLHSRSLHLELESQMRSIDPQFDYQQQHKGIYHIYNDSSAYESALKDSMYQQQLGLKRFAIDIKTAVEQEPSLRALQSELKGVIYTPEDFSGDIHLFCQRLFTMLTSTSMSPKLGIKHPVQWIPNIHVQLASNLGRVHLILNHNDQGHSMPWHSTMHPDLVIVSAASYTNELLKPIGLSTRIYPTKGYAMNLHLDPEDQIHAPTASISDDHYKVVWSRLGNTLRAAGTAEISGYNAKHLRPERCAALLHATNKTFPQIASKKTDYWAGLRPLTPSNVPIIAKSEQYTNLMVCSGHGSLGWTMMAGAGQCAVQVWNNEYLITSADKSLGTLATSTPKWSLDLRHLEPLIETPR